MGRQKEEGAGRNGPLVPTLTLAFFLTKKKEKKRDKRERAKEWEAGIIKLTLILWTQIGSLKQ